VRGGGGSQPCPECGGEHFHNACPSAIARAAVQAATTAASRPVLQQPSQRPNLLSYLASLGNQHQPQQTTKPDLMSVLTSFGATGRGNPAPPSAGLTSTAKRMQSTGGAHTLALPAPTPPLLNPNKIRPPAHSTQSDVNPSASALSKAAHLPPTHQPRASAISAMSSDLKDTSNTDVDHELEKEALTWQFCNTCYHVRTTCSREEIAHHVLHTITQPSPLSTLSGALPLRWKSALLQLAAFRDAESKAEAVALKEAWGQDWDRFACI